MSDVLTKKQRSKVMSRVRNRDTEPELRIRKLVFSMGYRYRLYRQDLPGKPDLVFSRKKKIIFVHGCFWHGHTGCPNYRPPKSNLDFWIPKINKNKANDLKVKRLLRKQGWHLLILWECQLVDENKIRARIGRFLESK